jgi:hypothetical protein
MGSVGIAGMGTAIGVPVAAILLPMALLSGGFVDNDGLIASLRDRFFGVFTSSNSGTHARPVQLPPLVAEALEIISERIDGLEGRAEGWDQQTAPLFDRFGSLSRKVDMTRRWLGVISCLLALLFFLCCFFAFHLLKR